MNSDRDLDRLPLITSVRISCSNRSLARLSPSGRLRNVRDFPSTQDQHTRRSRNVHETREQLRTEVVSSTGENSQRNRLTESAWYGDD